MLEQCAFAIRTHPGYVRDANEDAVLVDPLLGLAGVFDGMGGAQGGELASTQAKAAILEYVTAKEQTQQSRDEILANAMQSGNAAIRRKANGRPELKSMGTTAVVCWLQGDKLTIAHVGDSRAYLFRGGQLRQLTQDHTVAWELFRAGTITQADVHGHPYQNVLSRHLGSRKPVSPEVITLKAEQGDRILLCSDGVHGMIPGEILARTIGMNASAEEIADEVLALALRCGGKDNIGLALVDIGGREAPRTTAVIRGTGANTWQSLRQTFLEIAQSHNVQMLLQAAGQPPDSTEKLFDAITADLRRGSGFHIWRFASDCGNAWSQSGNPFSNFRELTEIWRHACLEALARIADQSVKTILEITTIQMLLAFEGGIATHLAEKIRKREHQLLSQTQPPKQAHKRSTLRLHSIPPGTMQTLTLDEIAPKVLKVVRDFGKTHEVPQMYQAISNMLSIHLSDSSGLEEDFHRWWSDTATERYVTPNFFAALEVSRHAMQKAVKKVFPDKPELLKRSEKLHVKCALWATAFLTERAKSVDKKNTERLKIIAERGRIVEERLRSSTHHGLGPTEPKR